MNKLALKLLIKCVRGWLKMLSFNEATHEYRLDGVVVPSVTQIIAPLSDHSGIPEWILRRKQAIGKAVHKVCELHDNGKLDEASVHPDIAGYFDAYKAFLRDTCALVLQNEQPVYSYGHKFAGTLDRIYEMPMDRHKCWNTDDRVLCDLKTVVDLKPATGPQTAGYLLASNIALDTGPPIHRCALQLKPTGQYHIQMYTDSRDKVVLLSCLQTFNWKKNHGIK